MKHYAGIGSRETPKDIRKVITSLASKLEEKGWTLRSGGANGADAAFESGVKDPENMEIFLPETTFNGRSATNPGYISIMMLEAYEDAMNTVSKYHPATHKLSPFAKRLMARNSMQVLGQDLKTPSNMVICWTPNGEVVGGTGQALRIAKDYDIPIFNLGKPDVLRCIKAYIAMS